MIVNQMGKTTKSAIDILTLYTFFRDAVIYTVLSMKRHLKKGMQSCKTI